MAMTGDIGGRAGEPVHARWTAGQAGLWIGVSLIVVVSAASLGSSWLTAYSPLEQDLLQRNVGPSAEHLLGTDHLGRDILARLLYGARITFVIALGGTLIAFGLGACLSTLALALGRYAEALFFGLMDLIRALPGTLLALLLIVALGSGSGPLTIALGVSFAPLVAYVARAAFHREMAREYVLAARSFGGGELHILRLHILPNVIGALITQFAIILPRCIVTESVLSFLGVGSSPDAPTWGRMIADSTRFIERAPHAILLPVVLLVLMTLSLSIVGNHLRKRFDPMRRESVTVSSPAVGSGAEPDPQGARSQP